MDSSLDFLFNNLPLILIAIVVALTARSVFRLISTKKKMKDLAFQLGLKFNDHAKNVDQFVRKAGLEVKEDHAAVQHSEKLEKVMNYLSFLFPWEMEGKYNGIPVKIFTQKRGSGKNSTTYTIITAIIENQRSLGLKITTQGWFSTIGQSVFGMKDINTGNEQLDKQVVIKAENADEARMLLSNPFLQETILKTFQFNSSIEISDSSVTYSQTGIMSDAEKIRAVLDHVSRAAVALNSALRR